MPSKQDTSAPLRHPFHPISRMKGLTLVELMVSITIMLVITAATVALYSVNSSSYRTVDSSQEMDTTARYIFSLMATAVGNAGYIPATPLSQSQTSSSNPSPAGPAAVSSLFDQGSGAAGCSTSNTTEPCPLLGFDAAIPTSSKPFGNPNDSGAVNKSDLFSVRFYGSGVGAGDGTMVTCAGQNVPEPTAPATLGELGVSQFWIAKSPNDNEPSLYCGDNAWSTTSSTWKRSTDVIARGVEVMHIVYAVDTDNDEIPDQWKNASDITDWQKVKSIRIGLVLRGSPGSGSSPEEWVGYPLGEAFTNANAQYKFTSPKDNRLRKAYATTFTLRNSPNL